MSRSKVSKVRRREEWEKDRRALAELACRLARSEGHVGGATLNYQDFLAEHKSESPFTLLDRLVRESMAAPDQARAKLEKVLYVLQIVRPHKDYSEEDVWPRDVQDPQFDGRHVCK